MPRGRALGSAFEHRVKKLLGGRIWPGLAGDVEARGYRIECKHRTGMKLGSTTELRDILDQILRYEKAEPDITFIGAITGGRPYQGGRVWMIVPLEEFSRLTDPTNLKSVLESVDRLRDTIEERYS